jgi:hypothetical protein
MLVRLARGLYLLFVMAMLAFYAVSAGNSVPAPTSAPQTQPQEFIEWC